MSIVYVVGVGPSSPVWLTPMAKKAIEDSSIIVAWNWSLRTIDGLIDGKKILVANNAKTELETEYQAANEAIQTGKNIAVLRVGDPCVSSQLSQILGVFRGFDIQIIPSVGSIQLAAARARICIDESFIVSFHDGRKSPEVKTEKLDFLLEAYHRGRHLVILTNEDQLPRQTASFLQAHGISSKTPIIVCENLSLKNEKVYHKTLGEICDSEFDLTSILVIKNLQKEDLNCEETHDEKGVNSCMPCHVGCFTPKL